MEIEKKDIMTTEDLFEAPSFSLGFLDDSLPSPSPGPPPPASPSSSYIPADRPPPSEPEDDDDNLLPDAAAPLPSLDVSPPQFKRLRRGPPSPPRSRPGALQSFWKSLAATADDKKKKKEEEETNFVQDSDDIEAFSSEEEALPCKEVVVKPGGRKLSLSRNAEANQCFTFPRPSMKSTFSSSSPSVQTCPRAFAGTGNAGPSQNFRGHWPAKLVDLEEDAAGCSLRDGAFLQHSPSSFLEPESLEYDWLRTQPSNFSECTVDDARVKELLRRRLPHFTPISALQHGDERSLERVYIDYLSQFSTHGNLQTSQGSTNYQKDRRGKSKRRVRSKKRKESHINSEGMNQNGTWRSTHASPAMGNRSKAETSSDQKNGYWVTMCGKRVYVTRDGQTLSGSSAYKQHLKESGKSIKKRRQRTRKKK